MKSVKRQFFGGPISFKITQTKEKETRKGKSGRKKRGEEKKAMVAVLMFNMANRWVEKVNLAVMFSRNNLAKITRQEIKQPLLSF